MASLQTEKRGSKRHYRVAFHDKDHKRRSIRLGPLTKKSAETIRLRIEDLVAASIAGAAPSGATSKWVSDLGDELTKRLARAGLVAERGSASIGAFVDAYVDTRTEAAENTIRNFKNTRRKLTDFFGEDRNLRDISPGDADDWRQWLIDKNLSPSTVSKAIKHSKQFMKFAKRKNLIEEDPFRHIVAGGEKNDERRAYVPQTVIERVLAHCPDTEWRLLVALCRFGGLRCPTEVLALQWTDIDWAEHRITVRKIKTSTRTLPVFPELYPHLREAHELARDRTTYCITRYRGNNSNLRTQFQRIIDRAGVPSWPRLFQNLRASCETDLSDHYPTQVVVQWMGNSQKTAAEHYLLVTQKHCERAIREGLGGAHAGAPLEPKVVQQPAATGSVTNKPKPETP
jgi:integrase